MLIAVRLVAALCAATVLTAAPAQASQCLRTEPSERPAYAVSGAWSGSTLLVVDSRNNEILRYSDTGLAKDAMPGWLGAELGEFFPSAISSRADGQVVLELHPGRLLTLDGDLRLVSGPEPVLAGARRGAESVEAIFQWSYAGPDLVTCSDVLRKEGDRDVWGSGILRIPAQRDRFAVLYRMQPQDSERLFCRLGFPYIAALGDTAYFLVMEDTPRLYKHAPGDPEPTAMDVALPGRRPSLPILPREDEFAGLMKQIEGASLPVGLYAWNGRLYVLSRQPGRGGTEWSLSEIDPESGRTVTARLASTAPHLTVVPGPRQWAVLEKAAPLRLGNQPLLSLLLVPAEEISSLRDGRICDD